MKVKIDGSGRFSRNESILAEAACLMGVKCLMEERYLLCTEMHKLQMCIERVRGVMAKLRSMSMYVSICECDKLNVVNWVEM